MSSNAPGLTTAGPAGQHHPRVFDADQGARFERAGWEAYYDRRWLRVLRLMVQLNREQFGMSLPAAMAAALDIVRASRAFAPVDNDVPAATPRT